MSFLSRQDSLSDEELRAKAHRLIPGGSHTYAKGDDQFPSNAPPFIVRGKGCRIWDRAGNEYVEYGMGLRSVTLGHAYEPVQKAVAAAMELGTNFGRPSPLEVDCAEKFLSLVPTMEMVKFTKDGSTALTAGVKLARAFTGKKYVAFCKDHPFFSYDDWFIGTTAIPAGIPEEHVELSLTFRYNDLGSLAALFERFPDQIACVVLEPMKVDEPAPGFLEGIRELCDKHGAVLMLDEMITGFRWDNGGAQKVYGVQPDLSTFGKALANGYALSALAGKREIMDRGGIHHEHERVFLLSTTHGAELTGLAAAIATMEVYETEPVCEHLRKVGAELKYAVNEVARKHGVHEHVEVIGPPQALVFTSRDRQGEPSQPFRTLLLQELIKKRVLAPSLIVSYSHRDSDVAWTVEAFDHALQVYAQALARGVENYLVGPATKGVYRSRN